VASVQRTDSRAVLIRSAEPCDRIDREEDQNEVYCEPVAIVEDQNHGLDSIVTAAAATPAPTEATMEGTSASGTMAMAAASSQVTEAISLPGYSCDFPALEFEDFAPPIAPSVTTVEALNLEVALVQDQNQEERDIDNEEADREGPLTVVLDMDTSDSVI